MNYLLDTNHISPLVTIDHPLRQRILSSLSNGDTFAIVPLALNEFLFGISMLPRATQNLHEWEHLKSDFEFHNINLPDAEAAAKLRVNLRKRGWQLEVVDSFIAVVALRNNLTLLTTDKDFSAVPNLQRQNWLA